MVKIKLCENAGNQLLKVAIQSAGGMIDDFPERMCHKLLGTKDKKFVLQLDEITYDNKDDRLISYVCQVC